MVEEIIFGNILRIYGTLDNHLAPHGSSVYDLDQIHEILLGFEAADKLGVIWWPERKKKRKKTQNNYQPNQENFSFVTLPTFVVYKSLFGYVLILILTIQKSLNKVILHTKIQKLAMDCWSDKAKNVKMALGS